MKSTTSRSQQPLNGTLCSCSVDFAIKYGNKALSEEQIYMLKVGMFSWPGITRLNWHWITCYHCLLFTLGFYIACIHCIDFVLYAENSGRDGTNTGYHHCTTQPRECLSKHYQLRSRSNFAPANSIQRCDEQYQNRCIFFFFPLSHWRVNLFSTHNITSLRSRQTLGSA